MPTLAGKAAIDIPEGTQAGKQFRLRGKGIKGVRSSYPGDLYCHIAVETPVKLTEHQRALLRELEESLKRRRPPFAQRRELDGSPEELLQLIGFCALHQRTARRQRCSLHKSDPVYAGSLFFMHRPQERTANPKSHR